MQDVDGCRTLKRIQCWGRQMESANTTFWQSSTHWNIELSVPHCVHADRANLGLRLHAVPVISPPSGRVGARSSQGITAGCMDLRAGFFVWWDSVCAHMCECVHCPLLSGCLEDQASGWLQLLDSWIHWLRCHGTRGCHPQVGSVCNVSLFFYFLLHGISITLTIFFRYKNFIDVQQLTHQSTHEVISGQL